MTPDQIATKADVDAVRRDVARLIDLLTPRDEWESADAYAARKGVTRRTILNWAKRGKIVVRGTGRNMEVKL